MPFDGFLKPSNILQASPVACRVPAVEAATLLAVLWTLASLRRILFELLFGLLLYGWYLMSRIIQHYWFRISIRCRLDFSIHQYFVWWINGWQKDEMTLKVLLHQQSLLLVPPFFSILVGRRRLRVVIFSLFLRIVDFQYCTTFDLTAGIVHCFASFSAFITRPRELLDIRRYSST